MYGDIDGNKAVDLSDLLFLSMYLLHEKTLTESQQVVADVNGDNIVDISDLPLLKQFIMKDKIILGPKK